MANEEKGLKAEVVSEKSPVYKRVDEMSKKEIEDQFRQFTCVLNAKNSRKNRSTWYYRASLSLASGIDLSLDLIGSEYALILAERGVADIYRNIDVKIPVYVRLVKGQSDDRDYSYAEIRFCKDVVKSVFLDPNQMKLLEIRPELAKGLLFVRKEGGADKDVSEQTSVFNQVF